MEFLTRERTKASKPHYYAIDGKRVPQCVYEYAEGVVECYGEFDAFHTEFVGTTLVQRKQSRWTEDTPAHIPDFIARYIADPSRFACIRY